jgi:tRNA(fMet)-specific endonuclease VapC
VPVLDTDVLTIVQRREEPLYSRLVDRLRDAGPTAVTWVTIVSFEEQMRGWLAYVKSARPTQLINAYRKLQDLYEDFGTRPTLNFDARALDEYHRLKSSGLRVGMMDLKIAALAIAHGELLISRNLRDFSRVPNLRVEDWTR